MLNTIKTWFDNTWSYLLSWGRDSATILWARVQGVAGLLLAAATAIDWSGLANLDWANDKKSLYIGLGLVANAILTEAARRRTMNA